MPYAIGENVGGGILFYLADPPADLNSDGILDRGLVIAPEDILGGGPWSGGANYDVYVTPPMVYDIGEGYNNCQSFLNFFTSSNYAVSKALGHEVNGYVDWFLPTIHELRNAYDSVGPGSSLNNLANFDILARYWTSSNYGGGLANTVLMNNGNQSLRSKLEVHKIRAIRVF